jgi:glycosyltransferase involved in cell wall biosynthesis
VRIALDATYSVDRHPSGIAVYSREMMAGLAAEHPEDSFLFCYRPKQIRHAPAQRQPNAHRRILVPPLATFRADLFHALNQRVDKRPAKRVVSTFHDLFVMTDEYSSPDFRIRFSEQARRAAQNSDMIVTVSEFTAKQVNDLLGVPRTRIRVVQHGVKMHDKPAPLSTREKLILFVGTLQTRKNVVRLIEAFEALGGDWRLVLAGASNGYGAEEILERIESSRSRNRIQMMGYVSHQELQALYAVASIFAFPSLAEGFGLPVLEAMAHGVPVITSNGSALVEVAGDAAYLVDPLRTDEIAGALKRFIESCELREEFRQLGLQRASLFSWRRAVEETYGLYKELLD